jgi:hypothetical protein
MSRGKHVLLIPSKISPAGAGKLSRELTRDRVKIIGKAENLILANWDDNTRAAVTKGPSIQVAYVDKISPAAIRRLPAKAARIAVLWNWRIDKRGRRVTDAQVNRLMAKLKLEERNGQTYDRLGKKYLGRIKQGEKGEKKGNWWLCQNRGWYRFPGWFGYWEKLWCKSRTCTTSSCASRLVVDYILAEVDGPQHYAYQGRYNASIAYAYDWDYIWIGESHCGTAFSYARRGSSRVSITRRIC